MTDKVQGVHKAGEFLGKNLDFFTVTISGTSIAADGVFGSATQLAFEKMVAVIGTRAQPIILGTPSATILKFAVEHNDAWSAAAANSATVNNSLQKALEDAGFTVSSVVKADTL